MFFNNMIFKFNTEIRIGTYLKAFPQEYSFWYPATIAHLYHTI